MIGNRKPVSFGLMLLLILEGGTPVSARAEKPRGGEIQSIDTGDNDRFSLVQIQGTYLGEHYAFRSSERQGATSILLVMFFDARVAAPVKRTQAGKGVVTKIDVVEMNQQAKPVAEVFIHYTSDQPCRVEETGSGVVIKIPKGHASAGEGPPETASTLRDETPPSPLPTAHVIQPGDVLYLSVSPAEELSQYLNVDENGRISIPLLGAINVAGRTVDELAKSMTQEFSEYVTNPKINILVKTPATNKQISLIEVPSSAHALTIFGEIARAGVYDYVPDMRVLDLISLAQGFKEGANFRRIKIFRGQPPNQTVINVRFSSVLNGHMKANIPLEAGDVVYVPRHSIWSYSAYANAVAPLATLALTGATIFLATK